MADCREYFTAAKACLAKVKENQRDNILKAADLIGNTMTSNGIVQLVGFKHNMEFSMELGYRAGGLMPFHRWSDKDLPMKGLISPEQYAAPDFDSHVEYMQLLWDVYNIDPADLFLVTSDTGCDTMAIEVAKLAKGKGHKVIGVVSASRMASHKCRHGDGHKLDYYADLLIDTGIGQPDGLVEIDGLKICPVQTLCANVIAQMLTAEMYHWFTSRNLQCPILLSANVTGADVHNRAISDKYLGRWNA